MAPQLHFLYDLAFFDNLLLKTPLDLYDNALFLPIFWPQKQSPPSFLAFRIYACSWKEPFKGRIKGTHTPGVGNLIPLRQEATHLLKGASNFESKGAVRIQPHDEGRLLTWSHPDKWQASLLSCRRISLACALSLSSYARVLGSTLNIHYSILQKSPLLELKELYIILNCFARYSSVE